MDEIKHYYVTCMHKSQMACSLVQIKGPFFPLGLVMKDVMENNGFDSKDIVILDWKELTPEQFVEAREFYKK